MLTTCTHVTVQATDVNGNVGTLEVAVTVTDAEDGGPWHRYDLNKDGVIDRDEALKAVVDYFG